MSRARMTSGPHFDSPSGLVSGEIALPGGLPPEEPEPDAEVDSRTWRTDLLPGPAIPESSLAGDAPGAWNLYVDGVRVADTAEPLTNGQAHDWARAQLGEGVRFEPALADHAAEHHLRHGRGIDWVANPWPSRLHGLRSELTAPAEVEREVQA